MGAQSQTSILDLKSDKQNYKNLGKLIVRCEKVEQSNGIFRFMLEFLVMNWRA